MSASLVTQNFNLPVYAPNDITSWLTDFNGAMSLIDAALQTIKNTADTADADVVALENQVTQLKNTVQAMGPDVTKATNDIIGINAQLLNIVGELSRIGALVDSGVGETKRGVIGIGETTITLQFTNVTDNSLVDVYFGEYGLTPQNVTTDTVANTVTVDVEVRLSNVAVAVIVR